MFRNDITWISTIDEFKYNSSYKYSINTWNKLPGNKKLFLDGDANVIPEIEKHDFWSIVNTDSSHWLKEKRPAKANRFWFKGHTIYSSVKEKYSRYIVWIDADVYVKKEVPEELITTDGFPFAMMEFKHSLYPEGHLLGTAIESGLQIFDTQHPDIDTIIEDYYSYWETGEIFNLYRAYDGWVSTAISKKYKFLNLVNYVHEKRFIGENTFLYTNFSNYLIHFLGKENKGKIKDFKDLDK